MCMNLLCTGIETFCDLCTILRLKGRLCLANRKVCTPLVLRRLKKKNPKQILSNILNLSYTESHIKVR